MKRFVSIPSSRDLIVKWAEVMVVARSLGRRIEVADAWVAATALLYDAPLVTVDGRQVAAVSTGTSLAPTLDSGAAGLQQRT